MFSKWTSYIRTSLFWSSQKFCLNPNLCVSWIIKKYVRHTLNTIVGWFMVIVGWIVPISHRDATFCLATISLSFLSRIPRSKSPHAPFIPAFTVYQLFLLESSCFVLSKNMTVSLMEPNSVVEEGRYTYLHYKKLEVVGIGVLMWCPVFLYTFIAWSLPSILVIFWQL